MWILVVKLDILLHSLLVLNGNIDATYTPFSSLFKDVGSNLVYIKSNYWLVGNIEMKTTWMEAILV
jgi:hypothetical protein